MKTPPNNPAEGIQWYAQNPEGTIHYAKASEDGAIVQYSAPEPACPRCGGDHGTMIYLPIRNPQDHFTFFAMCPTLAQPIWLGFSPENWKPCPTCKGVGEVRKEEAAA